MAFGVAGAGSGAGGCVALPNKGVGVGETPEPGAVVEAEGAEASTILSLRGQIV